MKTWFVTLHRYNGKIQCEPKAVRLEPGMKVWSYRQCVAACHTIETRLNTGDLTVKNGRVVPVK